MRVQGTLIMVQATYLPCRPENHRETMMVRFGNTLATNLSESLKSQKDYYANSSKFGQKRGLFLFLWNCLCFERFTSWCHQISRSFFNGVKEWYLIRLKNSCALATGAPQTVCCNRVKEKIMSQEERRRDQDVGRASFYIYVAFNSLLTPPRAIREDFQ